jgi:hypothetical protein
MSSILPEVMLSIFERLGIDDLISARLVCRSWYKPALFCILRQISDCFNFNNQQLHLELSVFYPIPPKLSHPFSDLLESAPTTQLYFLRSNEIKSLTILSPSSENHFSTKFSMNMKFGRKRCPREICSLDPKAELPVIRRLNFWWDRPRDPHSRRCGVNNVVLGPEAEDTEVKSTFESYLGNEVRVNNGTNVLWDIQNFERNYLPWDVLREIDITAQSTSIFRSIGNSNTGFLRGVDIVIEINIASIL